jgi:hypothetical protein
MTTFCFGVYVLNDSVWPPQLPNVMAEGTLLVYSMYSMCRDTTGDNKGDFLIGLTLLTMG